MSASPFSSSLPDASTYKLVDFDVGDAESPLDAMITFTFQKLSLTGDTPEDPETAKPVRSMRDDPQSVSLQLLYDHAGDVEYGAALERGEKSKTIWFKRYTYTTRVSNYDWSEKNCTKVGSTAIGTLTSPTGITSPTADYWMFLGLEVDDEDGFAVLVENWLYSPVGIFP
jgi:hypothetical protein